MHNLGNRRSSCCYIPIQCYTIECLVKDKFSKESLTSLQLIQNSLARAVTRTPRHHHITPVLKSLHWLKIPERIHFKVLSLQFPAVFPAHIPSRTLHHPANTLYSIIILSHPSSPPGHFSPHVFQPSHINHCTTSLE